MLFRHYPRLTFIAFSFIAAILVFLLIGSDPIHQVIQPLGIGGIFVLGMLYTYSFTAGAATLLLPSFAPELSLPLIAIVGGLGAAFADTTILRLIRSNLKKELDRLGRVRWVRKLTRIPIVRNPWMRNVIGFIILASPLPDEIGVALMATTDIAEETFQALSFVANCIGIYLLVSALAPLY